MKTDFYRFSLLAAALACTLPALAQQKMPKEAPNFVIPKQGQWGWKRTKMTAAALAKKVDAAMKSMKNVGHQSLIIYEGAKGNGHLITTTRIKDQNTYSIEFINFDVAAPHPAIIRADGKNMAIQGPNGWSSPTLLAKAPKLKPAPGAVGSNWPLAFPRMMFANLTLKTDIWSALIRDLTGGAGGYKTTVEERTMVSSGKKVLSYRIVARRPGVAAKKITPSEIEMVIDGTRFLPVTLRANFFEKKATKMTKVQWNGGWKHGVQHKAAEFKLPRR